MAEPLDNPVARLGHELLKQPAVLARIRDAVRQAGGYSEISEEQEQAWAARLEGIERDLTGTVSLTPDQREVWETTKPHEYEPSGDQTPDQARNMAVDGYQACCELEGVTVPSEETILAEIDRRRGT